MPSQSNKPTRRALLAAGVAFPFAAAPAFAAQPYARVRRLDPALDALIARDIKIEEIASEFSWTEGPVWVKQGGFLLFSNLGPTANTIYRWSRKDGVTAYIAPAGLAGPPPPTIREPGSNGLAIDHAGKLIICNSGGRSVDRCDLATRKRTTLVDRFEGKRLNSPNDLAIDKSGAIYFTDPPYGLAGLEKSPVKELDFSGIYRLTPDGKMALLDKEFLYPNGIALAPDQKTLFVCNTDQKLAIIRAYQLGADGMPASHSTFFDFRPHFAPGVIGVPDGMKIDVHGNIFAAGPGGHFVISPEGKLLGVIEFPGRYATNSAFGEDGFTFFIAATDTVARMRLRTKGANLT
ncbi:MAG: SMP-30/gluconolactonase/LRE family protein [Alphaproteobacteria bacterium]|nr:SMP-30/gluconolactonase/LRE family protein [Alphaproteobacteria bacterium]